MLMGGTISLLLGMIAGRLFAPPDWMPRITKIADGLLFLLLFFVGISIGSSKESFRSMKQYQLRILFIPLGIILGSLGGGYLCAMLFQISLRDALLVVSGLGWYSLSGVIVTDLVDAKLGALSFLSCLLRELLAFVCVPFLARKLNFYTAIAPAGATSMDTCLPFILRYTNAEVAAVSVLSGVLCTAAVPFLLQAVYQAF